MDAYRRRTEILDRLEHESFVKLSSLVTQFGVSPVTIHRDLDYLAETGAVRRVRGGVRPLRPTRHEIRTDYLLRSNQEPKLKAAIAEEARTIIADGSTIFLDASTTAFALARALERNSPTGLTIITNSPAIAFQVHSAPLRVIVLPGDLDQSLRAVTGTWTVDFIANLNFSVAFISAAGITVQGGLMTQQRVLADVIQAALSRAAKRVALVDSSKFNTTALIPLATKNEIDLVITDDALDKATEKRFVAGGWRLQLAPLI